MPSSEAIPSCLPSSPRLDRPHHLGRCRHDPVRLRRVGGRVRPEPGRRLALLHRQAARRPARAALLHRRLRPGHRLRRRGHGPPQPRPHPGRPRGRGAEPGPGDPRLGAPGRALHAHRLLGAGLRAAPSAPDRAREGRPLRRVPADWRGAGDPRAARDLRRLEGRPSASHGAGPGLLRPDGGAVRAVSPPPRMVAVRDPAPGAERPGAGPRASAAGPGALPPAAARLGGVLGHGRRRPPPARPPPPHAACDLAPYPGGSTMRAEPASPHSNTTVRDPSTRPGPPGAGARLGPAPAAPPLARPALCLSWLFVEAGTVESCESWPSPWGLSPVRLDAAESAHG